eukprot:GHVQ01009667.1.p1 GENE.GHVQ01009667.1~~GHVQ01009667.1.p1  ORF type:complete len:156 (+),score=23.06 GHVQ01009667.1:1351-1818(+)
MADVVNTDGFPQIWAVAVFQAMSAIPTSQIEVNVIKPPPTIQANFMQEFLGGVAKFGGNIMDKVRHFLHDFTSSSAVSDKLIECANAHIQVAVNLLLLLPVWHSYSLIDVSSSSSRVDYNHAFDSIGEDEALKMARLYTDRTLPDGGTFLPSETK